MNPSSEKSGNLRLNRYATVIDTIKSIYIILEDRGTVTRIDRTLYPHMSSMDLAADLSQLPSKFRNHFLRQGIIVSKDSDERAAVIAFLKRAEDDDIWRHLPAFFHLFLTHTCNFRCVYCIQGYEVRRIVPNVMTEQQVHLAFQQVREICDRVPRCNQPTAVTLFGGEPLLPSTHTAVKTAVDEAESRGIMIHVVTNGYNYDMFAEVFEEVVSKKQVTFLVSLDGPCEIHNQRRPLSNGKETFHKVAHNISRMLEAGAKVVLQPILDEDNMLYLDQLYNLCLERGWLGFPEFSVKCGVTMFPNAHALEIIPYFSAEKQVLAHLLKTSKRFGPKFSEGFDCGLKPSYFLDTVLRKKRPVSVACGCSAIKQGAFSFSPDGLIYPCREYAGRGESYAIGRYIPKLEIFDELFRSWYNYRVSIHPKCSKCKHVLICGGGCRVHTETSGNTLENPACPNFEEIWTIFLESYDSLTYHPSTNAGWNFL